MVRKRRLDNITMNRNEDLRKIIYDAFYQIDPHQVAKCVSRSLQLLPLDFN